jgi:hypothetical protein
LGSLGFLFFKSINRGGTMTFRPRRLACPPRLSLLAHLG